MPVDLRVAGIKFWGSGRRAQFREPAEEDCSRPVGLHQGVTIAAYAAHEARITKFTKILYLIFRTTTNETRT